MAVGKAAMHRSYLYPHNPTFGALSQGRARFFCAKAGLALLFQHKLCWARKLRSNTPCPGSTFSCSDCLVHTNRAGGSPLTDGGFFAEPQLECLRFPPSCESPLSLGGSDADYRHVTAAKRETAEEFFYRRGAQCAPLSRHIRSARYRSATHTVYSAQSAAQGELPVGQERVPWGIAVPRKS